MDKQFFRNISSMIEDAFIGYEELLNLYKEKKQTLLKRDTTMLSFIDEKIVAQAKYLTTMNQKREDYCKENDIAPIKITELIELAQKEEPEFTEIYEKQKVKIREVADELALIEKTNVELIKHSLTMSDKLLDIIISAAVPQKDNYDQHGKNIDTTDLSIGSIVEEA